jgi:hypothetical protein
MEMIEDIEDGELDGAGLGDKEEGPARRRGLPEQEVAEWILEQEMRNSRRQDR